MMIEKPKILLIDDEHHIIRFLQISLQSEGYRVTNASTGSSGLRLAVAERPDLIVLDLGLPDLDGLDVLKELRRSSTTPVLVLSVRAEEGEKVRALDLGANDYVTKPFGIQEFMARVRVLLRSPGGRANNQDEPPFCTGDLEVDFAHRQVMLRGERVHLSRKEYEVLMMLARHPDLVVRQRFLLEHVWGPTHCEDTHYLRIVIARLRQKLLDDPMQPVYIHTEQGVGYRLVTQTTDKKH